MPLKEIAARAPIAVVAEITAIPVSVSADGRDQLTTISINQAIWGTDRTQLQVATPGGARRVGKLPVTRVVPGAPQLLPGRRLVLFLQPKQGSDALAIVGFNQGMLDVSVRDEVTLPGEMNATPVAEAMHKIRQLRLAAEAAGTTEKLR